MPDVKDPNEALTLVFASLQRAGNHWAPGGTLLQTPTGYEAIAELQDFIPPNARVPVRDYIKEFLKDLGWKKVHVTVSTTQVRIAFSRA